ncbi:UDP-N-acetylmuramate--L-alanine ligase [Taibaiella lutea]|uniref:UDP-N-acetylmuramate--L-alanine ligase n=1 Tax=Taibaiella lutea TaxID=2608001 RepID=A0A5M6CSE8_9BACT|nr:UDP-N-acetylmuramate--L-alanine ligase [Taibaiella lutea]KAA5537310.1 UDP-N-acetylmuramate--L-alanine ligase [Taibaiella lutea]
MNIDSIQKVYFVGIGGIGMSALARFFNERGAEVKGYDRTETELTNSLKSEGIKIHFEDNIDALDKDVQLVVYTPAIPANHKELNWYRDNNYPVYKRSDVLQWITESMFAITVAGTHGKTTISTMIAHILRDTGFGCNAFLGGISANYEKNYWGSENKVAVIEADEYDRSFLKLKPDVAVLTAMDADHLDIYGDLETMEEAFIQYTKNIKADGSLWAKHGLKHGSRLQAKNKFTYSLQNDAATAYASEIRLNKGGYIFNVTGDEWKIEDVHLNIGGMHNVENVTVAIAVAKQMEIDADLIKQAVSNFKGVKRRFEYIIKDEKRVFIDDYAHHPEELAALIKSAKALFPNKRCVVAFQPHLFSRTRDFAEGFAHSLDMADEVLLLDIYPARELPMEGISIRTITERMANPNHTVLSKEGLVEYAAVAPIELLITAGAGDIDKLVQPMKEAILNR